MIVNYNDFLSEYINPTFLWIFLISFIFIVIIITFIFNKYWEKYGVSKSIKNFAISIFWIVSIFLIIIMSASLIAYEYL